MAKQRDYALAKSSGNQRIAAPDLPYLPRDPKRYRPAIGLIACGGITSYHLKAYKAAGYNVVAVCDCDRSKAEARRKGYYPDAAVYTDYREVIKRDDIEVLDVATHPRDRLPILKAAIRAKKHVLSQKPFVTDIDVGRRLVDLADQHNVKLAVNQNGRWAPHFSYIRQAIAKGLVGTPFAAHLAVHWDHNWVKGTPFENVRHIVLYDFAIHWFDILTCLLPGQTARRVYASNATSPSQTIRPPLLGQAVVEYDHAQASLDFDADVRYGKLDHTYVAGPKGTLVSQGPSLTEQSVTLYTAKGYGSPKLEGTWFENGFHGTMAELLLAIEQNREPLNSARSNLPGLALCFAACASADSGKPIVPGTVRKIRP
jgi:predicted dehydrogenase